MPWPKGYDKPDYNATPAQLMVSLRKTTIQNHYYRKEIKTLRKEVSKVKRERRLLKEKLKADRHVDKLRFIKGDMKYYWGILSYLPIQSFLKSKDDLTSEQLRLLMLTKYHKYLMADDLLKWFIGDNRILKRLVDNGYLYSEKPLKTPRLIYFLTEKGQQVLKEYTILINKYLNTQLKLKTELENEETKRRRSKTGTDKVFRVS